MTVFVYINRHHVKNGTKSSVSIVTYLSNDLQCTCTCFRGYRLLYLSENVQKKCTVYIMKSLEPNLTDCDPYSLPEIHSLLIGLHNNSYIVHNEDE